jgi:hypothetical protein
MEGIYEVAVVMGSGAVINKLSFIEVVPVIQTLIVGIARYADTPQHGDVISLFSCSLK